MKRNGKGDGLVRAGDLASLRDKVADIGPRESQGSHPPAIPTESNQQLSLWQNFLYNRESGTRLAIQRR